MERYSSFYPFSIRFLSCWFLSRAISVRLKRETAIPQGASNICIHFNISMWALFRRILSWRFVNINDGVERWACLYTHWLKTNPFVIWFEQPLYCKWIREVRFCSYGLSKLDVVHIFEIRTDSSHWWWWWSILNIFFFRKHRRSKLSCQVQLALCTFWIFFMVRFRDSPLAIANLSTAFQLPSTQVPWNVQKCNYTNCKWALRVRSALVERENCIQLKLRTGKNLQSRYEIKNWNIICSFDCEIVFPCNCSSSHPRWRLYLFLLSCRPLIRRTNFTHNNLNTEIESFYVWCPKNHQQIANSRTLDNKQMK